MKETYNINLAHRNLNSNSFVCCLQCGIPSLAHEIIFGVRNLGWEINDTSRLGLLIDAPSGFALQVLDQKTTNDWVVVTDNPCPEYWEDLWSLSPRGLLAGGNSALSVTNALRHVISGGFLRSTPEHRSSLTRLERSLLQYNAQGWDNKRIAKELELSDGTIRNALSRVFQKLGFENRTQLALYYWGLWHLLDRLPQCSEKLTDS